jgi:hypothetical protein
VPTDRAVFAVVFLAAVFLAGVVLGALLGALAAVFADVGATTDAAVFFPVLCTVFLATDLDGFVAPVVLAVVLAGDFLAVLGELLAGLFAAAFFVVFAGVFFAVDFAAVFALEAVFVVAFLAVGCAVAALDGVDARPRTLPLTRFAAAAVRTASFCTVVRAMVDASLSSVPICGHDMWPAMWPAPHACGEDMPSAPPRQLRAQVRRRRIRIEAPALTAWLRLADLAQPRGNDGDE